MNHNQHTQKPVSNNESLSKQLPSHKKHILVFFIFCLCCIGIISFRLSTTNRVSPISSDDTYNSYEIVDGGKLPYKDIQKPAHVSLNLNEDTQVDSAIIDQILQNDVIYSEGNPEGKFVIIKFFDYNCSWCMKTARLFQEAFANNSIPNVRLVLVHTPIFPESLAPTWLIMAAQEQGMFSQLYNAVLRTSGKTTTQKVLTLAEKLGINTQQLQADANTPKIQKQMDIAEQLVNKLKLEGVPILIINGKLHRGALIGEQFEQMVIDSNQ